MLVNSEALKMSKVSVALILGALFVASGVNSGLKPGAYIRATAVSRGAQ
jgi:hypothetical protein